LICANLWLILFFSHRFHRLRGFLPQRSRRDAEEEKSSAYLCALCGYFLPFFARKHRIAIGRPINIREWLPKNHKSHEKRRSGAGSPVLVCVSRRTPRRPAGNIGSAARLTRPLDRSRTGGFVSRGATARPRTTSVFTSKPAPKITNGNECRESHECGRALSRVPSSGGGVLSRVRPSWMPAAYLVIRRQQPRDRPLTLSIRSHS